MLLIVAMSQNPNPSYFNWLSSRISVKLALIMILVVVIPLVGLGLALRIAAEKAVKISVQRDQQEIAKRTAHELSLFVERPLELLNATGSMIAINQTDSWKQETVLVELSTLFSFFEEVISVDSSGKVLATSNPGKKPEFVHKDKALSEVLNKDTYTSEVYLSGDYLPYLDVGIPYFWRGKVSGALLARINLRGMWDIIDGIHIGKTGRAFLVSDKGILIAHPDKRKVLLQVDLTRDPAVAQVLQKKTGTLEMEKGKEGEWLVSYSPIPGEFDWGIVIEQRTSESYSLLNYMRWMTWIAGFLAVLVAILVSIFTARRVVRPVRMLDFWSRRISIGDFDYVASHRSKDELGRLFIAFKRMRDRLREAREQEYLAMLGTASSALAHKIKNSVVSLKTLADLFPIRKKDERFLNEFEAEFPHSVENLEKILRQLSKVASEYSLSPTPVDLRGLIERVKNKYREVSSKQKVECSLVCESFIPSIDGDSERLSDVFENLIVNAIEAMPEGGKLAFELRKKHGRIIHPRLMGEDELDFVEIVVRDTGKGIPKGKLDEVFHPFVTTKRGGMGIGLTVVKKIVQEHGGSIQVESEPGYGTTFTILIPLEASKFGVFK